MLAASGQEVIDGRRNYEPITITVVLYVQTYVFQRKGRRKALSEHLGRMTSHLSGHRLDDFVKLNKLGEGTYGVVFKVSKH